MMFSSWFDRTVSSSSRKPTRCRIQANWFEMEVTGILSLWMTQITELPCKSGTWAEYYRQLAAMVNYKPRANFCIALEWNRMVMVDLLSCIFVILSVFCCWKLHLCTPLSSQSRKAIKGTPAAPNQVHFFQPVNEKMWWKKRSDTKTGACAGGTRGMERWHNRGSDVRESGGAYVNCNWERRGTSLPYVGHIKNQCSFRKLSQVNEQQLKPQAALRDCGHFFYSIHHSVSITLTAD